MATTIQVFSEIGQLRSVLLKRPGREVENLTPATMSRLLFDDIPYLPGAQKEHDAFATLLRQHQVNVLYLEALVAEAIETASVRVVFLDELLAESGIQEAGLKAALQEYLDTLTPQRLIDETMAGIRRKTLGLPENAGHDPFLLEPMPSLYFTRDPASSIGHGMTLNHMTYPARKRESLFMHVVLQHHPRFAGQVPVWLDRQEAGHIEGGDILVLSEQVVAVAISQRTQKEAIDRLAKRLFANSDFRQVLAIRIPNERAMMHLDTVFTMVDRDKFTYYPGIETTKGKIDCYLLEADCDGLKSRYSQDLAGMLKELLGLSQLIMIPTGDGDAVAAPREQWTDGSNTLALAPGVVVTYDRNQLSNESLRRHGITVLEIPSAELSRGRGGPRCMSQPLVRENLV